MNGKGIAYIFARVKAKRVKQTPLYLEYPVKYQKLLKMPSNGDSPQDLGLRPRVPDDAKNVRLCMGPITPNFESRKDPASAFRYFHSSKT